MSEKPRFGPRWSYSCLPIQGVTLFFKENHDDSCKVIGNHYHEAAPPQPARRYLGHSENVPVFSDSAAAQPAASPSEPPNIPPLDNNLPMPDDNMPAPLGWTCLHEYIQGPGLVPCDLCAGQGSEEAEHTPEYQAALSDAMTRAKYARGEPWKDGFRAGYDAGRAANGRLCDCPTCVANYPKLHDIISKALPAPPQPSAPWPNPETPRTLVKDHGPRIDTTRFPPMVKPTSDAEPSDCPSCHSRTKSHRGIKRALNDKGDEFAPEVCADSWHDSPAPDGQHEEAKRAEFCPTCGSSDPKRLLIDCTHYGQLDPWHYDADRAALRESGKGEV